MGARGPAAKPTVLRAVPDDGRPAARTAKRGEIRAPAGMSKGAMEVWKRKAPELKAQGLLKPRYVDAFAHYCEAAAFAREARERLVREGTIVEGHRGVRAKNPAWQIWRDATAAELQLGARFGMTPADDRLDTGGPADGDKGNGKGIDRFFTR